MNLSIKQRLPIVAIAAFTLFAASAQATHWPMAGGDSGRSGFQVADQAALPMKFRWRIGDNVRTSPIITSGANLEAQRVAWGHVLTQEDNPTNVDGLLRVVKFSNGLVADVDLDDEQPRDTPASGADPDHDPDMFGPSPTFDVAPVEASAHTGGSTQIYVVHNDDNQTNMMTGEILPPNIAGNDIALAQIRSSDGVKLADQSIGSGDPFSGFNTNGWTVASAPVITPDQDVAGDYDIIFLAYNGDATDRRIIKLNVSGAASNSARPFTVEVSGNITDLNTRARPTIVGMLDPDTASPRQWVAVGTGDGVKTFRVGNLTDAGPFVTGLGLTGTPSVPVLVNGNPPSPTPFIYVASSSPGGTIVRKLKQNSGLAGDPSLSELVPAENDGTSPELSGVPAHGLAVAQSMTASNATPSPGRVVVTTSTNLYTLNTENLGAADPPALFNGDASAGNGFSRTIAATSGGLGFAVTDSGKHHVFYLTPQGEGGLHVPIDEETGFIAAESSLNATAAVGQPAVSRGRAVLPSNNGAYAYGASVTILQPGAGATVQGANVPLEAYVYDTNLTTVQFKIDGNNVGSPVPVTANHAVSSFNSTNYSEGVHTVTAVATGDGVEPETSAPRAFTVNNFGNPTATLTVSPNPGNVNQPVTLNASGSAITQGENETIDQWAFDVDGDLDYDDGVVENRTAGCSTTCDGVVTHVFTTPGSKTVSVRVRDSHGDIATKSAPLRINTPPDVALKATPNPAAAGQTVTIDATGTSDPDGSIAKYEFDRDGNGTFEHDNGTNPTTTTTLAGTANVGVRVTDNEGGQTIKTVTVTVTAGNQAPTAAFIVAPNPAKTNQDVGFSAAASKDPDGKIVKYEWDFDGNGTFETNGGELPLIGHKFTKAGVFKVGLRVTDNAGATGTTTVDVIVSQSCAVNSRCRPGLSVTVRPTRDRSLPYVFTTRGRLRLPAGVRKADGCKGRVLVQVKRGKRTISSRRVRVRSSTCRFTSKVTFRDRARLGTAKKLRFSVRFQGNRVLTPRSARVKTVRIG